MIDFSHKVCYNILRKGRERDDETRDYVITIAMEMKRVKDEIHQLQFQVYELMQILKLN